MKNDNKMLDNCTYDLVAILKKVSCTMWFIKQHALDEAKKQNNTECTRLYTSLLGDLEKYVEPLKKEFCKLCEK